MERTDRIDPGNLTTVTAVLVGEERASGPKMAEWMGEPYNTVWAWLNRRGMPVAVADRLATYMEEHGLKLIEQASVLRQRAREAREAGRQEPAEAGV